MESAEHSAAPAADNGVKPALESRDKEPVTSSSSPRGSGLSDLRRDSDLLLSARRTSVDYFQKVRIEKCRVNFIVLSFQDRCSMHS